MTIMWTVASFLYYMLNFMNKYFEGSMYANLYLDACAGIVGNTLGLIIYKLIRMKWAFIIALILTFLGGLFLIFFQ